MKQLFLRVISLYQNISKQVRPQSPCRFSPTCSQYMYDAVSKYGTIKGVLMGIRRILKCHPLNKGGYHPLK